MPAEKIAERKVVGIPSTTYDSIRLGQLFRVDGFVYVLISMARSQDEAIVILEPKQGTSPQPQRGRIH